MEAIKPKTPEEIARYYRGKEQVEDMLKIIATAIIGIVILYYAASSTEGISTDFIVAVGLFVILMVSLVVSLLKKQQN
jgi:hypothetical protein